MKTSIEGIELIKRFERFVPEAYRCPAGVLTIGYGHTGQDVREGMRMTEPAAEALLLKDVAAAEAAVGRRVRVTLKPCQFDALVSFTYNLGEGNLKGSTLLRKVNNDPNDKTIGDEFPKWVYAGGRRLIGLANRRLAECRLYFKS